MSLKMLYKDSKLHQKIFFSGSLANKPMANAGKCHFICSSNQKDTLTVENEKIANNICVELLDVKIDFKLTFNTHLNDIC